MRAMVSGLTIRALLALGMLAASADAREEAPTVLFHHTVVDMADSLANITEMLVVLNPADSALTGIVFPLPEGAFDVKTGDPGDFELDTVQNAVVKRVPLAVGTTTIMLGYSIPAEGGRFRFQQRVNYDTDKYVFVATSEKVTLSSTVLAEDKLPAGDGSGARGLSGRSLSPGTILSVEAAMSQPSRIRGFLAAVVFVSLLLAVVYASARMARRASVSGKRVERLRKRRDSLAGLIASCEGGEKPEKTVRARRERLGATERLLALIEELRGDGT